MTARAVVVGCAIGVALAACNVFVGLKLGFYDAGAVTAAIVGHAALGMTRRRASAGECASLTTCASSAAVMAGASGLLGPVTAMIMLGAGVSLWAVTAWALALAALGIALALPLRGPLIDHEGGLPFPTARATAEVIASLVTTGGRRVAALGGSGAIAALITWFRDGSPSLIPASVAVPGAIGGYSLASLTIAVPISPLFWAAGALVGVRNSLSMLVGTVVAWLMLAPVLIDRGAVASGEFSDVVAWLLWPGAAMLIASTLTTLVLDRRALIGGVVDLVSARASRGVGGSLAALAILVFLTGWLAIGVHPAAVAVAVIMAPILAAACARAAGETDLAPIGPVGGVAQIALGPVTPANAAATLGGGAVVSGVASQTAQTMYALRTGALLGLPLRPLLVTQLVGAAVGAVAAVGAYILLTRVYILGSDELPCAAVQSWRATADAVARGFDAMPAGAQPAALIGVVAGVALTLLERSRFKRYAPAPIAVGTAFLIPGAYTIAMTMGALIYAGIGAVRPNAVDEHGPTVAAGALAGEAITGLAIAILLVVGALG